MRLNAAVFALSKSKFKQGLGRYANIANWASCTTSVSYRIPVTLRNCWK
jgi:hypothetical protein